MAITYITGIPRSGKSYYAMYLLYNQFIKPKPTPNKLLKTIQAYLPKKTLDKSYDIAYTNINQFDFTKSDKIKPFEFNDFQLKLAVLHNMYLQKATDDTLIIQAKLLGLYNALFVIDEAQNFFSSENIVSTWWFTYHGHLHQDIILITQNLDLIEKSYFKLAEFFYKAVPPSSRFFSNKFRYIQFNSSKLFQKDKIGDFHVPMVHDIFNMYVSGASNTTRSQVKKYLSYFVFLFLILIIAFYYFIQQFNTSENIDTNITEEIQVALPISTNDLSLVDTKNIPHSIKHSDDLNKTMLFEIKCFDMLCTYENTDFPKPLLNKILSKQISTFTWFFQNGSYMHYFVMLPNDTFQFLKIGEKTNEKNTKSKENTLNNPSAKLVSK